MLRPQRDEGERPAPNQKLNRKAPLIITTALLITSPICLAEAAIASTSSFGLDRLQYQSQIAQGTLKQSQPKSYQGSRLLSSTSLPSESEISSLESILAGYQSKLASLKETVTAKRPELASLIAPLEREISLLAQDIANARSARAALATAITSVTKAADKYDVALKNRSTAKTALDQAKTALDTAKTKHDTAKSTTAAATTTLAKATTALDTAKTKRATAQTNLTQATTTHAEALQAYNTAQANLAQVTSQHGSTSDSVAQATSALSSANATLTQTTLALTAAQEARTLAQAEYTTALANYNSANATLQQVQGTYDTLTQQLQSATQALAQAQQAYDTNLIPDPNFVPPAQVTPVSYTIPDANFQTGTPWTGGGSGTNGAPEIHPGHIHFSYVGTEVYQDIELAPRQIANYNFTVSVYNQDQNSVGYGTPIPDTYGLRIYFYDANNNLVHQNSVTSSDIHSWRDVVLQGNTNTQTAIAKVRIGIYGIDNGFWAGTYGPAANNVRLQLGWSTPTLVQQTINVDIRENDSGTFTAPAGSTFTGSNLRYEAYANPSCGANITPQVAGLSTITLRALNSVWGDPCGGYGKHIIGTLTYLATPTAPLINDASLLPVIASNQQLVTSLTEQLTALAPSLSTATSANQDAQALLTQATTALQTANANLAAAQTAKNQAETSKASAESTLASAQTLLEASTTDLDVATTEFDDATLALTEATTAKTEAQSALDTSITEETAATQAVATAESELTTAQSAETIASTELTAAESLVTEKASADEAAATEVASALEEKTSAETTASSAQTKYSSAISAASATKPDFSSIETELAKPEPAPEENGSEEIPAELTAENLLEVDLEKVDPTELTPAQAEQLKEAALETFETATQGSPEYEQALDALFVAAQQDDIVLPESLAAIPGAAALVDAINFLGNAGADMSPQVREQSEKVVVTAVVAAGVAVQSAAAAATTAAASASAPSGGSRRIGK